MLEVGEHAPWFIAKATNNDQFNFSALGGNYVVLAFFGSASKPGSQKMLDAILKHAAKFDDENICLFGVSSDVADEKLGRVKQRIPGIRYFWDFDNKIAKMFKIVEDKVYYPAAYILDPTLRVIHLIPLQSSMDFEKRFDKAFLSLPKLNNIFEQQGNAPVIIVPRVFEPEFSKELIGYYNRAGGKDSGFMFEKDGVTVGKIDYKNKRRKDCIIENLELRKIINAKLSTRLLPSVQKAFQFEVTRIERYLIAEYSGDAGGFFFPHRDNTTKGTAHRKFAVTINLNAEDFTGGELRFPEFGEKTYRAPTGGAVVFSCSLLHEALPVKKGNRYAFLPFLYDEQGEKVRKDNLKFLKN